MIIAYGLNNWEWASAPTIIALVLVIGLVFGLFQASAWRIWRSSPSSSRWPACSLPEAMTAVISTDQLVYHRRGGPAVL